MTPLAEKIRREIELTGPISIAHYMAQCLFDPQYGYYTTREPFGAAGDFITAPEISQMFGEMLAAWWLSARSTLNLPHLVLAEAGPGRGTLMNDMLRTIRKVSPQSLPQVLMIEASSRLTQVQKELLRHHGIEMTWTDTFSSLPAVPMGIVANELFDAIPVRQFVKTADAWLERMVRLGDDGSFEFALGTARLHPRLMPRGHEREPEGQIFEYDPARQAVIESIALHLRQHEGFALFIDYGHAVSGFGDTLQAVRKHQPVGIFDHPGEVDLTTHVDFQSLARRAQANGIHASSVIEQEGFLIGTGIRQRAARLQAGSPPEKAAHINTALERLIGGDKMGSLFKVLALSSQKVDIYPLKFWH
jgi:SAM-dependent MidA family methyltransferase